MMLHPWRLVEAAFCIFVALTPERSLAVLTPSDSSTTFRVRGLKRSVQQAIDDSGHVLVPISQEETIAGNQPLFDEALGTDRVETNENEEQREASAKKEANTHAAGEDAQRNVSQQEQVRTKLAELEAWRVEAEEEKARVKVASPEEDAQGKGAEEDADKAKRKAVETEARRSTAIEEEARLKASEKEGVRRTAEEEKTRSTLAEDDGARRAVEELQMRTKSTEYEEAGRKAAADAVRRQALAENEQRGKMAEEEGTQRKMAEEAVQRVVVEEAETRRKMAEAKVDSRRRAAEDEVDEEEDEEKDEARKNVAEDDGARKVAEQLQVRRKSAGDEEERRKATEEAARRQAVKENESRENALENEEEEEKEETRRKVSEEDARRVAADEEKEAPSKVAAAEEDAQRQAAEDEDEEDEARKNVAENDDTRRAAEQLQMRSKTAEHKKLRRKATEDALRHSMEKQEVRGRAVTKEETYDAQRKGTDNIARRQGNGTGSPDVEIVEDKKKLTGGDENTKASRALKEPLKKLDPVPRVWQRSVVKMMRQFPGRTRKDVETYLKNLGQNEVNETREVGAMNGRRGFCRPICHRAGANRIVSGQAMRGIPILFGEEKCGTMRCSGCRECQGRCRPECLMNKATPWWTKCATVSCQGCRQCKAPPGFVRHGPGACSTGCYAGCTQPNPLVKTLRACARKCLLEPQCKFFAFQDEREKMCSRFNEMAGTCARNMADKTKASFITYVRKARPMVKARKFGSTYFSSYASTYVYSYHYY